MRLKQLPVARIAALSALALSANHAVAAELEAGREQACVAHARNAGHAPSDAALTIVSGQQGDGRAFVRLTWAANGRGDERFRAYECVFRDEAIVAAGPRSPLVMGPVTRDSQTDGTAGDAAKQESDERRMRAETQAKEAAALARIKAAEQARLETARRNAERARRGEQNPAPQQ